MNRLYVLMGIRTSEEIEEKVLPVARIRSLSLISAQSIWLASIAEYFPFNSAQLLFAKNIHPGEISRLFFCPAGAIPILLSSEARMSLLSPPDLQSNNRQFPTGSLPWHSFFLIVVTEMRSRVWKNGIWKICILTWIL